MNAHPIRWGKISGLAIAVVLANCGGGNGSTGGKTGVVATPGPMPGPTPTPTATPTPAATTPPAPFGLATTEQFVMLGWVYAAGSDEPQELTPGLVDLSWSASAGTYELTLPDVGSGRLAYTFPGSQNNAAFNLIAANGSILPVSIVLDDGRIVDPPYEATGTLFWNREAGMTGIQSGFAAFGRQTRGADLPQSGDRTYLTQGGESLLMFDFGSATFSGYARLAWVDDWGPYPPIQYDLDQMNYMRGDVTFTASFTVPNAPAKGELRGRFMGPNGDEIAIAWRGPVLNPYTQEWVISSGVWTGRVCSDCAP